MDLKKKTWKNQQDMDFEEDGKKEKMMPMFFHIGNLYYSVKQETQEEEQGGEA